MAEETNPPNWKDIHKQLGGTTNTNILIGYILLCDRNINLGELLFEGIITIVALGCLGAY